MKTKQINNIGAAFQTALNTVKIEPHNMGTGTGCNLPLTRDNLAAMWWAGESDPFGLASVAAAEQALADMRMARKFAGLIRGKLLADGKASLACPAVKGKQPIPAIDTTAAEGAAAGLLAVTQWRNGQLSSPAVPADQAWRFADDGGLILCDVARIAEAAAVVCWRAVVAEMSDDTLGETVELSSVSDTWLIESLDPLAVACLSIESRNDKASRLLRARGAARRVAQIPARLDIYKAGASKRRRELVDKIERAAMLLAAGASIDHAAEAVGFKPRPTARQTAGMQLARAAKAIGLRFNLSFPANGGLDVESNHHEAGTRPDGSSLTVKPFKPLPCSPVPQPVQQAAAVRLGTHCGAACIAAAAVRNVRTAGLSSRQLSARAARRGAVWQAAQDKATRLAIAGRAYTARLESNLVQRSRIYRKHGVLIPV